MTTTLLALAVVLLTNYCIYKRIKRFALSYINKSKPNEKLAYIKDSIDCIYGNTITILQLQLEQRRERLSSYLEKYKEEERYEECLKIQRELQSIEDTMQKIKETINSNSV